MTVTVYHAKERAEVVLPDGRTAWLVSVPGRKKQQGRRARVVLASGKYLSVDPDTLELA